MLLAEQTAVLARRQEETQRHFEMMLLAQRRQNREAMEKLQLQHARGSQQLLGVIQNQMGLSMGGVTPGMSGPATPGGPGPAPVTPLPRGALPPAKRRSRCNRCDACTTPLAANVRRQWCETWKPAGAVPRGPDGRYLKREAEDEGSEKQKKKKLKKEKKKRVAEAREHNPIKGPDDDFDSGGDSAEELFGAPAPVPWCRWPTSDGGSPVAFCDAGQAFYTWRVGRRAGHNGWHGFFWRHGLVGPWALFSGWHGVSPRWFPEPPGYPPPS